jgi:hypothetical protein
MDAGEDEDRPFRAAAASLGQERVVSEIEDQRSPEYQTRAEDINRIKGESDDTLLKLE